MILPTGTLGWHFPIHTICEKTQEPNWSSRVPAIFQNILGRLKLVEHDIEKIRYEMFETEGNPDRVFAVNDNPIKNLGSSINQLVLTFINEKNYLFLSKNFLNPDVENLWKRAANLGVAPFLFTEKKQNNCFIELQQGQSLPLFLEHNPHIDFDTRCCLARKLVEKLQILHANGIYHGNLIPSHILFSSSQPNNAQVTLTGWNAATTLQNEVHTPESTQKMLPEVTCNQRFQQKCIPLDNEKVDLLCIGLILFELFTGQNFDEQLIDFMEHFKENTTFIQKNRQICNASTYLSVNQLVIDSFFLTQTMLPPKTRPLLQGLLKANPQHRLSLNEALEILDS